MTKLDAQQGESSLAYQERVRGQMRDPLAPPPIAQDPNRRDEWRARERAAYVRQHAPTILAGLLADPDVENLDYARRDAIESAGLIFDETEPKP